VVPETLDGSTVRRLDQLTNLRRPGDVPATHGASGRLAGRLGNSAIKKKPKT
jgi:hypothetical protein